MLAPRAARSRAKLLLTVAQWSLAALAAVLLARTLVHADLHRVLSLVRGLGTVAPLLALPAVAVLVFETVAWRISLAPLGARPGHLRLARVRLATDSVLMSLPGGVVLSEWLMPLLLRDQGGLRIADAAAASAARKWLGTRAHAIYIFLAAALGWGFLARQSSPLLGVPGLLPWVVLLSGLLPLGVAVFMEVALARGTVAQRVGDALARIPVARWRRWLLARRAIVADTDVQLARLIHQRRARAATSTLVYLAAWLCESLEAYAIAHALGAQLGFTDVLAFEAGLSLVRSVVFFAPAGIGVQDLGYVALFASTGAPDAAAVGGAFVVAKRARELVWVAAGWVLVAAYLLARRQRVTRADPRYFARGS